MGRFSRPLEHHAPYSPIVVVTGTDLRLSDPGYWLHCSVWTRLVCRWGISFRASVCASTTTKRALYDVCTDLRLKQGSLGGFQCSFLLCWCRLTDSNRWHPAYKAGALPTELNRQFGGEWWSRTTRVAMTVDLQSTPLPLRTNSPKLAMVGGFEPPTSWLTANCSTAELHHQFSTASIYYSTVPIATV